jgi:hypothetical protein
MRDFSHLGELIDRIAAARREARDHAPKVSNDHQEAGIFLAMMYALDKYSEEQNIPATPAGETAATIEPEPEPLPPWPSNDGSAVIQPEELEQDQEPEPDDGEPDEPEPAARRRRRGSRPASDAGEGD